MTTTTEASTTTTTTMPVGYVPPDTATLTCEKTVAKALGKLGSCQRLCKVKLATAALLGKPLDEPACATACRGKFDKSSQKLDLKAICPACLDAAHRATLADRVLAEVDGETSDLYCEGTVPLP